MKKINTYTVFDLLIKYIDEGRIKLDKTKNSLPATYHDPCNYCRKSEKIFGYGYYKEPRRILDECCENWVDMYPAKENQFCCGGGGGTLVTGYNKERVFYGRKKMKQIKATGAKMIVVPCHSCHGQLNSIKGEYGMEQLEVKYLWDVVADALILDR